MSLSDRLNQIIKEKNITKREFANRVRTGMLISLIAYAALSAVVCIFAEPLLALMAANTTIIAASASYIRIESIANIFVVLTQFALVALVTVNKSKYLYNFKSLYS